MAGVSLANYSHLTKKIYRDTIDELALIPSPFFGMVKKEGGWTGDDTYNVPIIYAHGQGTGATFADAQANISAHKGKRPAISSTTYHGFCELEHKAIVFTSKKEGSPVSAITNEVDRVRKQMVMDLSCFLYGIGGGARGKRKSAATNVITLTNQWDTVKFYPGMTVRAASDEAGTSMRTGQTTVASVQIKAGTVTLTDASAITGFADNDFLIRDGDQNAVLTGLGSPFDTASKKGWLPNADPTSGDSFFGTDRSDAPEALAGWRITASGDALGDAMLDAGASAMHFGATIDCILANPRDVNNVIKVSQSKIFRGQGGEVRVGFTGITAELATGIAKVYSDPYCPQGRVYGLNMSKWHLKHAEDTLLNFVEIDGLIWRAKSDSNNFEARLITYPQLYCTAPGENFVIILT